MLTQAHFAVDFDAPEVEVGDEDEVLESESRSVWCGLGASVGTSTVEVLSTELVKTGSDFPGRRDD